MLWKLVFGPWYLGTPVSAPIIFPVGRILSPPGIWAQIPVAWWLGWLNDTAMDTILGLMQDSLTQLYGKNQKYMILSTFQGKALREGQFDSIIIYLQKQKIDLAGLQKIDDIYIPVCVDNNHWVLVIWQPMRLGALYCDSLQGPSSAGWKKTLCEQVQRLYEHMAGGISILVWDSVMANSPKQSNFSDCGIFVCMAVWMRTLGLDEFRTGV